MGNFSTLTQTIKKKYKYKAKNEHLFLPKQAADFVLFHNSDMMSKDKTSQRAGSGLKGCISI